MGLFGISLLRFDVFLHGEYNQDSHSKTIEQRSQDRLGHYCLYSDIGIQYWY